MSNVLRNLPSVNELLDSPPLRRLIDRASRNVVVAGVRSFLENLRNEVQRHGCGYPSAHAQRVGGADRPVDYDRGRTPICGR